MAVENASTALCAGMMARENIKASAVPAIPATAKCTSDDLIALEEKNSSGAEKKKAAPAINPNRVAEQSPM